MRIVTSFAQVDIVIKPIQDFISLFKTKDMDRHGLRLKNNGDAVDPQDYVTLKQIGSSSSATQSEDQYYTIVFAQGGIPLGGTLGIPPWVTGQNRTGIPIEVWGVCEVAPVGGSFVFNVQLNGNNILAAPISIPLGSTAIVASSNFVNPVPIFGKHSIVIPTITTVNSAAQLSIGIVVQRNT